MIRRSWVQTPLKEIFDEIYFVLCNFISVRKSDRNASDRSIVKNSIAATSLQMGCKVISKPQINLMITLMLTLGVMIAIDNYILIL